MRRFSFAFYEQTLFLGETCLIETTETIINFRMHQTIIAMALQLWTRCLTQRPSKTVADSETRLRPSKKS